jgi:hypothetical protein
LENITSKVIQCSEDLDTLHFTDELIATEFYNELSAIFVECVKDRDKAIECLVEKESEGCHSAVILQKYLSATEKVDLVLSIYKIIDKMIREMNK